ncbi:MAG: molybdopterin synthase sulfur carrier subunit [Solirubrobacterales bacterium]|nr:MAG: molybdopterin synthase sulfur carrier subunit [Solirubrobacterales bacterium]
MPLVCVHGPLRQLAGFAGEHRLQAGTVLDLLRELECVYPALSGWIVDERGLIRRHIKVFVNGERGGEHTAVAADARVETLPAITGG